MRLMGYGPFSDIVANIGYVVAAATAIRLGWLPRMGSKWLPDQDAVPLGYTAVLNLAIAVILVLMYVFLRNRGYLALLGGLTGLFLCCAVFGLIRTSYLVHRYGYTLPYTTLFGRKEMRVKIGGETLTPEADNISQQTNK